jgi:hypothetical protein
MRELMLENAGGKWSTRQEPSCILLADTELLHPGQPVHDLRERWKCKERAGLESRV